MDNATRNAGDMVKKYTLRYNRTRQAMITKELIEITQAGRGGGRELALCPGASWKNTRTNANGE